jgi:hypothetical protein
MTDRHPFSPNSSFPDVRMDEYNAAHWENRIRREQGLPLREFYAREGRTGFMPFVTAGTVGTGLNTGYNYNSNLLQFIYKGNDDGRN